MKAFLLLAITALLYPFLQVHAQDSYFQQRVDTRLEVQLDDTNHFLHGYVEMDYYNNAPDTLPYIYFHLWPNAYKNDRTAYVKQAVENGDTKFYFSKEKDRGYIDSLQFEVNGTPVGMVATDHIDIIKILLPQPLPPGGSVQISTPFRVKIPYTFSRLGHVGQSYQISQWFPKPAVYDRKGWHPMPYLDQGEFYSEFGSYDVKITLPKNYIVMATGNLENEAELQWLDSLAEAPLPPDTLYTHFTPLSSPETKTLHYIENNIHDFAWFADKTWVVRKDTIRTNDTLTYEVITSPQFQGKPSNNSNTTLLNTIKDTIHNAYPVIVTAFAAFFPKDQHKWRYATQSLKITVEALSKSVGPYPYKTIKAVEGSLSAGGGMEYPTVTVIAPGYSEALNHNVIVHEAGHNWFYGIIGSNERDHPWMDEGINNYYEKIITRLKYKVTDSTDTSKSRKIQDGDLVLKISRDMESLSFTYPMSIHEDLPSGAKSDTFRSLNYGGDVYEKTPYLLRWLRIYMGAEHFDAAMKAYYQQWKFKHPYPEDFQKIFQQHTTKSLDWFFNEVLYSNKPINFSLKKIHRENEGLLVELHNKTHIRAAIPVYCILENNDTLTAFTAPFSDTATVFFPGIANYKKILIAPEVPDYDLRNNSSDRVFKIKPFGGLNMDEVRRTWIMPSLGYNYYDGFMLGILGHNLSIPQNKLQYVIAPMFAFGSKTIASNGILGYTSYFDQGWLHDIQWKLEGRTYSYAKSNLNIDHYLHARYIRIAPEVVLNIRRPYARSKIERSISLKAFWISESQLSFNQDPVDSLYRPSPKGSENYLYGRLRYLHNHQRTFNPFSYAFEVQGGKDFAKITAEGNLKVDYFAKGKALYLRAFGGKFFNLATNQYTTSRYWLATTYSGVNDYLYEGTYLGRNEIQGFVAQQIAIREGGFKYRTSQYANPIGLSDDWLFSLNVSTDLPLGKIPLRAYAGVASFSNAAKLNPSGAKILFESGLELYLNSYLSVYFPVFMSQDYKNYSESVLGKNAFLKSISFSLHLEQIDWLNLPGLVFWKL